MARAIAAMLLSEAAMTMRAGKPSVIRKGSAASLSIDKDGRLGWTVRLTYVNHRLNVVSMNKPKMLIGLAKRHVIGSVTLFFTDTDNTITGGKMEPNPSRYRGGTW
jgi:hypothetical protein